MTDLSPRINCCTAALHAGNTMLAEVPCSKLDSRIGRSLGTTGHCMTLRHLDQASGKKVLCQSQASFGAGTIN